MITPRASSTRASRIRVAYFDDLTTLPIVNGLEDICRSGMVQRQSLDQVRESVKNREFEVALLPTVEALKTPGVSLIPCSCIATLGASRLFMIFSNKLPTDIKRVLVDHEDYGGTALGKLMFSRKLMVHPEFFRSEKPLDPEENPLDGTDGFDAYLLTGRNGFRVRKEAFSFTWDLTLAWYQYSRLPFVVNCWIVQRGVSLGKLEKELADTARRNEAQMADMAQQAERFNMSSTNCRAVYEKAFYTGFDPNIITSVRRFGQELGQSRIATVKPLPVYAEKSPVR